MSGRNKETMVEIETSGGITWMNPQHVVSITEDDNGTKILLTNGEALQTTLGARIVVRRITEAGLSLGEAVAIVEKAGEGAQSSSVGGR